MKFNTERNASLSPSRSSTAADCILRSERYSVVCRCIFKNRHIATCYSHFAQWPRNYVISFAEVIEDYETVLPKVTLNGRTARSVSIG